MDRGTPYERREDEFDLGGGCSFTWMYARAQDNNPIGIIEHHPKPEGASGFYCGGWVAWVPARDIAPKHMLTAGGPGNEEHLTITPSLLCRTCGHHGFIRDGKWVPA